MPSFKIFAKFGYVVGLLASVAVFFQLYISLPAAELNVNLADPIVMVALGLVGLASILAWRLPAWNLKEFPLFLLLFTAAVVLAFLNGVLEIGVTQWALIARLLGWIVLLGYVAVGTLIVLSKGTDGRRTVALLMGIAACIIIVFDMTMRLLVLYGWDLGFTPPENFSGFSQNRNAFAFQLSLVLALLIGYSRSISASSSNPARPRILTLLIGLILVSIVWTGSRSAMLTVAVVVVFCIAAKIGCRRTILRAAVCTVLIWCGVYFVSKIDVNLLVTQPAMVVVELKKAALGEADADLGRLKPPGADTGVQSALSGASSNQERMLTLTEGAKLWFDSPILGAGLGVFRAQSVEVFGKPQVIHNTALWLLAEFGVFGLLLVVWIGFKLLQFSLKNGVANTGPERSALLIVLLIAAGFSLFHEVFYQRVLWLVLGLLQASPSAFFSRADRKTTKIVSVGPA
jgi:hypothetical protein